MAKDRLSNSTSILSLLTILVVLSTGVFFYSLPQIVYFGYFLILSIFLLLHSHDIHFNKWILLIIFFSFFSICVNNIPRKFSSWERYIIFIIMLLPISSVITSRYIAYFRLKTFDFFIKIISILILLSFIGYLLHIGAFYHEKTHTFRGLMIYCMVLGPFAAIATIYYLLKYLYTKKKLYLIFILMSFLTCLLSGSRGAFIALVASIFYFLCIYCKNNIYLLLKSTVIIISLSLILIMFFPSYMDSLTEKQINNIEAGGTFASRSKLIQDRVKEFYEHPLFGSGFASVDLSIVKYTSVSGDGKVEPGSSWLFILSSIGILAFVVFIRLILYPLIVIYKESKSASYNLILVGCVMIIFVVHMIVEGYILSAGSFLFWGAWLVIGIIQDDSLNIIRNEEYSFF